MNADDRLTEILRAEAEAVDPSPAGFERIRDKIGARRHRVIWQRSLVAAAASLALIATGVIVFTGNDDDAKIGLSTATPTPPDDVTPSASPSAVPVEEPVGAVWPFTSWAEIRGWTPAQYPSLAEPRAATLAFLNDVLGKDGDYAITVQQIDRGAAIAEVRRPNGNSSVLLTTVTLARYGPADTTPWLVLVAENERLSFTRPTKDVGIRSPLSLEGTIGGVDEQVLIEVREAHINTDPLGTGNFRGGEQGWSGTVDFSGGGPRLALTAHTGSFLDGKPVTFAAIPVQQLATKGPPPPPPAPTSFVAVANARLALYDSATGTRTRYLTTEQPGGGVSDPVLAPDGTTVYFVRAQGTCAAAVHTITTSGGTEHSVVELSNAVPSYLSLSGDGKTLAYLRRSCTDQSQAIVLRDVSTGRERTWTDDGKSTQLYDLALSPSATHVALLVNECCDQPYVPALNVMEVSGAGGTITDGKRWGGGGSTTTAIAWDPAGGLLVAEEGAIWRFDRENDREFERLYDTPAGFVFSVDADRSGRHLVLSVRSETDETKFAIYRDGGDVLVKVLDGPRQATW